MAEFSFGQVEAILASLHDIAEHKRVAFAGRLKFLQKNGIPRRARPGRGKTGSYNFVQLMQLAAALELLKSGMTPQRAARLIDNNWGALRHTVYVGTYTKAELADVDPGDHVERIRTDWVWLVAMDALADLTREGISEFDDYEAIRPISVDVLAGLFDGWGGGYSPDGWRLLMINGTALTRAVVFQTVFQFRFSTVADLRDDIHTEVRELEKASAALNFAEARKTLDEDPARRTQFIEQFRELNETDFSTNPPRPPAVLRYEADEIISRLSPQARTLWSSMANEWERDEGAQVTITDQTRAALIELIDYGFMGADPDASSAKLSLEITPLGRAAMTVIRNREKRSVDPEA